MNRISFVLALTLILFSCELTYEDNRRLLVKGNVQVPEGSTIPNLPVEVYASGNFFSPVIFIPIGNSRNEDLDLIGISKVDSDGTYEVTTISPENEDLISIVINGQGNNQYKRDWPSLFIRGANFVPLEASTYNMPQVGFGRIIETKMNIIRQNNNTDTLYLDVIFNSAYKEIDLEPGTRFSDVSPEYASSILNPDEFEDAIIFRNIQNEPVEVIYQLVNNGIVGENRIQIEFDPEINGYEFRF